MKFESSYRNYWGWPVYMEFFLEIVYDRLRFYIQEIILPREENYALFTKQDERVNTFARNVITEVLSRKLERTRGLNELEFDVRVGIHSSLRHTYR